jgi:hypothetical protein
VPPETVHPLTALATEYPGDAVLRLAPGTPVSVQLRDGRQIVGTVHLDEETRITVDVGTEVRTEFTPGTYVLPYHRIVMVHTKERVA